MPEPRGLEYLVAVIQILPELERSAHLAEHIARRTLDHLGGRISPRSHDLIRTMSELVVAMWGDAETAYRKRERHAGFSLHEADEAIDELAGRLVIEGTREGADPETAVELALIARFYERIGDYAVNLGHRIETMDAPSRLIRLSNRPVVIDDEASPAKDKKGGLRRILAVLSRFRLTPKDDAFVVLFRSAADNARVCSAALATLVGSTNGFDEEAFETVRDCERRGDELTVEILRHLDASFVTPYDREDIHALAEELDDVVDDMFSAASRLGLLGDDPRPPELIELANVVIDMTDEMRELIDCLEARDGARFRLQRIEHLERQGDAVFQRGLETLFDGRYEALEVIKLKDILESLEGSCNAVEDVSDVVESILVKTS